MLRTVTVVAYVSGKAKGLIVDVDTALYGCLYCVHLHVKPYGYVYLYDLPLYVL